MIFETEQDRLRELKAIELYTKVFGGKAVKLGAMDIDFKIVDDNNIPLAYVEVKGRNRTMRNAYPLPVAVKKVANLMAKRHNPMIIWACEDGIIYGKVEELEGVVKYGGMQPRVGAANDLEMMCYFDKQKGLRYIRY
jgi:hypothetical protein